MSANESISLFSIVREAYRFAFNAIKIIIKILMWSNCQCEANGKVQMGSIFCRIITAKATTTSESQQKIAEIIYECERTDYLK